LLAVQGSGETLEDILPSILNAQLSVPTAAPKIKIKKITTESTPGPNLRRHDEH
jgi:hypothetical protein